MSENKNLMTAEGKAKLQEKLDYYLKVKRPEIAKRIQAARELGDLSENAEYDEAKNEQGILEAKIQEMELTIANADVVDESELSNDEVGVGSIVKLKDLELDEVMELQIVGSTEADPENDKISDDSPIGIAVMKKKVGDVVEVEAPVGIIKMEILEIRLG